MRKNATAVVLCQVIKAEPWFAPVKMSLNMTTDSSLDIKFELLSRSVNAWILWSFRKVFFFAFRNEYEADLERQKN